MKPTTFLFGMLPSLAAGTCFNSGEAWDRNLAPPALDQACNALVGSYGHNQQRVRDINISNGQCYHFVLRRLGGGDGGEFRGITFGECKDGMNKELFGCTRGGRSSYTNWEYT